MKPFPRDTYMQQLSGQELADYRELASQVPECERAHGIGCDMNAREMVWARGRLPPDIYAACVQGTSALTVRDCLVELAERGALAEKDLPSLPKDVREGAALVNAVTRPINAMAQAALEKRFEAAMVSTLAFAAQKLGKARGESAGEVTSLVDAVRAAVAQKNAGAVRDALDELAEFFDIEIDTPPPVAANRAVCRGVDVGIVTQLVR